MLSQGFADRVSAVNETKSSGKRGYIIPSKIQFSPIYFYQMTYYLIFFFILLSGNINQIKQFLLHIYTNVSSNVIFIAEAITYVFNLLQVLSNMFYLLQEKHAYE